MEQLREVWRDSSREELKSQGRRNEVRRRTEQELNFTTDKYNKCGKVIRRISRKSPVPY